MPLPASSPLCTPKMAVNLIDHMFGVLHGIVHVSTEITIATNDSPGETPKPQTARQKLRRRVLQSFGFNGARLFISVTAVSSRVAKKICYRVPEADMPPLFSLSIEVQKEHRGNRERCTACKQQD